MVLAPGLAPQFAAQAYGFGGTAAETEEEERRRRLRAEVLRGVQPGESAPSSGQPLPGAISPVASTAPVPTGGLPPLNLEPSPYGSVPRTALPDDATELQRTQQDIESARHPDAFKKQGLWKRLGTGLLAGIHDWVQAGQPGGAWGILGALGAGAAAHGISPTVDIENRRRMELGRLFNKYGQQNTLEKTDLERKKLEFQTRGEIYSTEGKRLENINKDIENKYDRMAFYLEQVKAGKITTRAMVDKLAAEDIPATEQDIREFERIYDTEGMPGVINKLGPPKYTPTPGIPGRPQEAIRKIKIPTPSGGEQEFDVTSQEGARIASTTYQNFQEWQERTAKESTRRAERAEDKATEAHRFRTQTAQQWRSSALPIQIEIAKQLAEVAGGEQSYDQWIGMYNNAIEHATAAQDAMLTAKPDSAEYGDALKKWTDSRNEANQALSEMAKSSSLKAKAGKLIESLRGLLPSAPELTESTTTTSGSTGGSTGTATTTVEQARRWYGTQTNPATGKTYTPAEIAEAIRKAQNAGRIKR